MMHLVFDEMTYATRDAALKDLCQRLAIDFSAPVDDGRAWLVTHPDGRTEKRPRYPYTTTSSHSHSSTATASRLPSLAGRFLQYGLRPMGPFMALIDDETQFDIANAVFCISHSDTAPLARVADGSLVITPPRFSVSPLRDTVAAQQLVTDIQEGRIRHVSFHGEITEFGAEYRRMAIDRATVRVAKRLRLDHICAAERPAQRGTSIQLV